MCVMGRGTRRAVGKDCCGMWVCRLGAAASQPALAQDVDLANYSNGFRIDGVNANDYSGRSVSGAGEQEQQQLVRGLRQRRPESHAVAVIRDRVDQCGGALEAALNDCVSRGDTLHDARDWPSPAIQFDSWLNRRLAVTIRGWGDLVRRWKADPAAFQTLNELEDIASFIADIMSARSRALARKRGYCPAVDLEGTSIRNSDMEMRRRWQRAVDDTALRHRNLIAMSVWDVFPQGEPADLRYFDLLPIVRCAHCLSFRRDVDIKHWNIDEFRRFYERVSAILQRNIEAGRIAKQV